MRHKRVILIGGILLLFAHTLRADYTFSMSLDISGSCAGIDGGLWKANAVAFFNHYINNNLNMGIPDRGECERTRQYVMSNTSYGDGSCHVRIICGPCTGSGSGMLGQANVGGPSQGSSFMSSNPANEVRDWIRDAEKLEKALSGRDNSKEIDNANILAFIEENGNNSDRNYDSKGNNYPDDDIDGFYIGGVFIRKDAKVINDVAYSSDLVGINPNKVLNKSHFYSKLGFSDIDIKRSDIISLMNVINLDGDIDAFLIRQYLDKTGIDIDKIVQKDASERTAEEQKQLDDYNRYINSIAKETADYILKMKEVVDKNENKLDLDLLILSEDSYHDSEHEYIGRTDFIRISKDDISHGNPFIDVLDKMEKFNATRDLTGFGAVAYYNPITNQYSVTFEGTEKSLWQGAVDGIADAKNAMGFVAGQYKAAKEIGEMIAKCREMGLDIVISGHSLGGGLATVAGITSGAKTVTLNAAGVSETVLSKLGIDNNSQDNITAYVSGTDLVNAGQSLEYLRSKIYPIVGTNDIRANGNVRYIGVRPGNLLSSPAGFHGSSSAIEWVMSKDDNFSWAQKMWDKTEKQSESFDKALNTKNLYKE